MCGQLSRRRAHPSGIDLIVKRALLASLEDNAGSARIQSYDGRLSRAHEESSGEGENGASHASQSVSRMRWSAAEKVESKSCALKEDKARGKAIKGRGNDISSSPRTADIVARCKG